MAPNRLGQDAERNRSPRLAKGSAGVGALRVPGVFQLLGAAGAILLAAYVFSSQVREGILGPLTSMRVGFDETLGIVTRRPNAADASVDPVIAVGVIVFYVAGTIYISRRLANNVPPATDLLASASPAAGDQSRETLP